MEPQACIKYNIFDDPLEDAEELEETSDVAIALPFHQKVLTGFQ